MSKSSSFFNDKKMPHMRFYPTAKKGLKRLDMSVKPSHAEKGF